MTDIRIEYARAHDAAAIEALLRAAFEQQDEADLVAALRRDGAIWVEWVATTGTTIVGFAALSRMRAPDGWACLAPVAVQPEHQNQGIGGALTRRAAGFDQAEAVVVLGDPQFYGHHGFDHARAQKLFSPYPVSHTLIAGGARSPEATLIYPAAFG